MTEREKLQGHLKALHHQGFLGKRSFEMSRELIDGGDELIVANSMIQLLRTCLAAHARIYEPASDSDLRKRPD